MQLIASLRFRFAQHEDELEYARRLALGMQHRPPPDELLTTDVLLREFAPHLVADVLAALTPASCSAYVVAAADDDRCYDIEPWFGTSFAADACRRARAVAGAYDGADAAAFALPVPNAFPPSDFALRHERKEEDGAAAARRRRRQLAAAAARAAERLARRRALPQA